MSKYIFHVDTFTSTPFRGNAVAVCVLDAACDHRWMLEIAIALNMPEVAFLVPRGPNRFDLRCMTSRAEVEPGSPAALAAAHVLFSKRWADPGRSISFFTHAGQIIASIDGKMIELNFPALRLTEVLNPPAELEQALERKFQYVGRRGDDFLVLLSSESTLKRVHPDYGLLRKTGVRGLIATAPAGPDRAYDFAMRTFYALPSLEGDDPLASSANSALGPFWLPRLGKSRMSGYRYSKWGGIINLQVDGDRVKFTGEAITILEGELKV